MGVPGSTYEAIPDQRLVLAHAQAVEVTLAELDAYLEVGLPSQRSSPRRTAAAAAAASPAHLVAQRYGRLPPKKVRTGASSSSRSPPLPTSVSSTATAGS